MERGSPVVLSFRDRIKIDSVAILALCGRIRSDFVREVRRFVDLTSLAIGFRFLACVRGCVQPDRVLCF